MARRGSTPASSRCFAATRPKSKLIARMAAQEERHLKRFNALMAERRVRPTALQPLWNVAGFALGAATALMSEKAALACTDAVETEIDKHYSEQLAAARQGRSRTGGRHRRFPGRRARASRHGPRGRCGPGDRLSATDCGDPCRVQGGNRAFEAHMRNLRRVRPLTAVKGRHGDEKADAQRRRRDRRAGQRGGCPDARRWPRPAMSR